MTMKLIIVSDIFGVTHHLITLADTLSPKYEIVDPYNGQIIEFESESQAYEKFSVVCGLQKYTDSVIKRINSSSEKILLLGFSVGASAIWNTLSSDCALMIEKAVCFYGSRIRDNRNLNPCCDTTLIFPCEEDSFSVTELSGFLVGTCNVKCINTEYSHGFMNMCSDNFDRTGYLIYLDWLKTNFIP